MIGPGVLLDTGPLVALLDRNDARHALSRGLFQRCSAPLRTCESVISEASFLLRKVDRKAPAELAALGRAGVFRVAVSLDQSWDRVGALLTKYAEVPASLADVCLIVCAEVHAEPRILTFDSDFEVYRWSRHRRFEILGLDGE
ncbi:MAG: PIN domain-containing protein [Deltaproteobacteria bacterium]|nr:PIN domain-containing protein [Deltaproteobacteria bacterium]